MLSSSVTAAIQKMVFVPQGPIRVAPRGNAMATAFCLDRRADTPPVGTPFKFAPVRKDEISVEIGGKTYSLQAAIDEHKIEIVGTGDFKSLQIKNLTSEEAVVKPKAPAAVAPDSSYSTKDIAPSLAALRKKTPDDIDQKTVWSEREHNIVASNLPKLGLTSDRIEFKDGKSYLKAGNFSYPVDTISMVRWQEAVRARHTADNKASYVVQRIESAEPDVPPAYVLYTPDPNSVPTPFVGNTSLGEVARKIRGDLSAASERSTPLVSFIGMGNPSDFDAARLTMVLRSGSAADGTAVPLQERFLFDTPPEWKGLWKETKLNIAGNPEFAGVTITKRAGAWEGVVSLRDASIKVIARTAELLAEIITHIREIMMFRLGGLDIRSLDASEQRSIAEAIRTSIEKEVHNAYDRRPELRSAKDSPVKVDIHVGEQTATAVIARRTSSNGFQIVLSVGENRKH